MDVKDAVATTLLQLGLPARRIDNTVHIYPDLRVEIDPYPGGAMLTIIGEGRGGPMVTYGTYRARGGTREHRDNVLAPIRRILGKLPPRAPSAARDADEAARSGAAATG